MDIEEATAISREIDDARQVDEITDDDYPPCIYNRESFHMDAGDLVLSDDKKKNDELRLICISLLQYPTMAESPLEDLILNNLRDNKITAEMLGG